MKALVVLDRVYSNPPIVVVGTRTTVLFLNQSLTHSLIQIVDYYYYDDDDDEDCAGRR